MVRKKTLLIALIAVVLLIPIVISSPDEDIRTTERQYYKLEDLTEDTTIEWDKINFQDPKTIQKIASIPLIPLDIQIVDNCRTQKT